MTKAELVAKIAKDAGITTVEAYKVLDSIEKAVGTAITFKASKGLLD